MYVCSKLSEAAEYLPHQKWAPAPPPLPVRKEGLLCQNKNMLPSFSLKSRFRPRCLRIYYIHSSLHKKNPRRYKTTWMEWMTRGKFTSLTHSSRLMVPLLERSTSLKTQLTKSSMLFGFCRKRSKLSRCIRLNTCLLCRGRGEPKSMYLPYALLSTSYFYIVSTNVISTNDTLTTASVSQLQAGKGGSKLTHPAPRAISLACLPAA